MGEVRRARDLLVDRVVALKILHFEHLDSPTVHARFEREVTTTAALQHPGIVPVYDRGLLQDGRPWFAMQEVRGRTIDHAIRELHTTADRNVARSRLQHLLGVMLRITETMAYAHSRRVVHRDLKPGNLMVGQFGEAQVMDWGISRTIGEVSRGQSPGGNGDLTQDGEIVGTLCYLPPEQAQGVPATPAADVFALSLVLYEVLTGQRLLGGTGPAILMQLHTGDLKVAAGLRERSKVDSPELFAIVEKGASIRPEDRFASGAELADALRSWLDGHARRQRARELLATARTMEGQVARLRRRLAEVDRRIRELRGHIEPFHEVEQKLPLWRAEDDAESLRADVDRAEGDLIETLRLTLQHDAELEEARRALGNIALRKAHECEERGDERGADLWFRTLRTHSPDHADDMARSALVIDCTVEAAVTLTEVEIIDRRPLPKATREIGTTPTRLELEPGRYELSLEREGFAPARVPLWIRRYQREDLGQIRLLECAQLGPDDVYVPGGWFRAGGDPLAPEPFPHERVRLEGFVIRRYPVTEGDYLVFLNDLLSSGREELALRYAPKHRPGTVSEGADRPVLQRDDGGQFRFAPDEVGRVPEPSWPVASIDWHSACAYADWLAERTGQPWRLPTELEWEKAARGVDARPFPWGSEPEPTWACLLGSTGEIPGRMPVTSHPVDCSPYGVRGMGGNVRDWCADEWTRQGPALEDGVPQVATDSGRPDGLRVIRGGAWNSVPSFARSAGRFAARADAHFAIVGFRLARSLPP